MACVLFFCTCASTGKPCIDKPSDLLPSVISPPALLGGYGGSYRCRPADFQSQLALLHGIADLLNRRPYRVHMLISPDYNRKVLPPKDKEILYKLFGEANVFVFSGINEYTNDYHYYDEQGYYRPLLGKKLLERIYGHSL